MKKLKLGFLAAAMLFGGSAFAQPVSDVAVIPVAVTINTVMRLNVESGGNVEFIVNTIQQYEDGISNPNQTTTGDIYDTRFTVASSRDFNVFLDPEDATFIGTDNSSGSVQTIPLNNVGYFMSDDGSHTNGSEFELAGSGVTVQPLQAASTIIVSNLSSNAGSTDDNDFTINWELATSSLRAQSSQETLLAQSISQDRYVTNVYLFVAAD